MNILTLIVSMLFSFDYSFMMEQRGYFSSDSGNYWYLVKANFQYNPFEKIYVVSECFREGDTLSCRKYFVNCNDGNITRDWDDNKVWVDGIYRDDSVIFEKFIFSNFVTDGNGKYVDLGEGNYKFVKENTNWGNITCVFDSRYSLPILRYENYQPIFGCSYSGVVIQSESYEAQLCKEGEE